MTPRAAIAVGVLVLVASVVSGREKPQAAALPEAAHADAAPAPQAMLELDLERLARREGSAPATDLFAPLEPERPPAPKAAGAKARADVPEKPQPPELPFTYFGQMLDGGSKTVFLTRDSAHYSVSEGQVIDGEYRVESIAPGEITMTYLPLGVRQTLVIPRIE